MINNEKGINIYCVVCDTNFEYEGVKIIGYYIDKNKAEEYCKIYNDIKRMDYYILCVPQLKNIDNNHSKIYTLHYYNNNNILNKNISYKYVKNDIIIIDHPIDFYTQYDENNNILSIVLLTNNYSKTIIDNIDTYFYNKIKKFLNMANNDMSIVNALINGTKQEIILQINKS